MKGVIEHLKIDAGYSGKSEQWRYGFDLACRELQKRLAVPDGFKLVSFKQISELAVAVNMVDLMTHTEQKTDEVRLAWQDIASKLQAMIEAAQEQE